MTHVIIERSATLEGSPVTLRVFVTGARGSALVEMSTTGEVLAVHE